MQTTSLNVLLVDDQPERMQTLHDALHASGHTVVSQLTGVHGLSEHVQQCKPDIVIIDMDSPDRDTLESMAAMSRDAPRPIVFFAEQAQDAVTIGEAIRAGVSTYIADGLQPDRVRPIIETAIAHFHHYQQLRSELDATRDQLASRKVTEKAKGLLMKHHKCSEEQAFKTLRKLAMDRGQKLTDVASEVIRMFEANAHRGDDRR